MTRRPLASRKVRESRSSSEISSMVANREVRKPKVTNKIFVAVVQPIPTYYKAF